MFYAVGCATPNLYCYQYRCVSHSTVLVANNQLGSTFSLEALSVSSNLLLTFGGATA